MIIKFLILILNRFKRSFFIFKKPRQAFYEIKNRFLKIIFFLFSIRNEYVFLSGSECLNKFIKNKNIKIIKGHSWDISQIYSRKSKKNI